MRPPVNSPSQEGFPPGSIIFLDIEEGGRLAPFYYDYLSAWIDALARFHYRSGAYCSGVPVNDGNGKTITTMKDLQEHLKGGKLTFWIFNDVCPPSPGCVFPQTPPGRCPEWLSRSGCLAVRAIPRRKDRTRCARNLRFRRQLLRTWRCWPQMVSRSQRSKFTNPSAPRE